MPKTGVEADETRRRSATTVLNLKCNRVVNKLAVGVLTLKRKRTLLPVLIAQPLCFSVACIACADRLGATYIGVP